MRDLKIILMQLEESRSSPCEGNAQLLSIFTGCSGIEIKAGSHSCGRWEFAGV